jgi:hypothetical protein
MEIFFIVLFTKVLNSVYEFSYSLTNSVVSKLFRSYEESLVFA